MMTTMMKRSAATSLVILAGLFLAFALLNNALFGSLRIDLTDNSL